MSGVDAELPAYGESSLLPVAMQVQWERGLFLDAADRIAGRFSYPEWKKLEIAASLEMIFDAQIADGKTFEEAILSVEIAVKQEEEG